MAGRRRERRCGAAGPELRCRECGGWKPEEDFYRARTASGRQSYCRWCTAARATAARAEWARPHVRPDGRRVRRMRLVHGRPLAEWARRFGLAVGALRARLRDGWAITAAGRLECVRARLAQGWVRVAGGIATVLPARTGAAPSARRRAS